ncbi:tetratricopeptide repeat protein [Ensifer sp. LBL]|uniref:tetratricopeptide repeat protein n=1 Tax=Ensifer sp. LBL TaxID=2991056 RepID=UPI003D1D659A
MEASRNAGHMNCIAVAECEARAALERILADSQFHATERHRKLLRYLVDEFFAGRSGQVKAYTIAIDVFGRPASFDPATDPIVRVEASRLRAAMAQYYEALGERAELRIELPKGNYVPQFVISGEPLRGMPESAAPVSEPAAEQPVEPVVAPAVVARKWPPLAGFAALGAGAVVMAGAFYLSVADHLPWQPVFSAKPTIVVDVPTRLGADDDVQKKAGDYLVHALSQFSAVRTLAPVSPAGVDVASITGWVSSAPPVKLQGSKEYRLSIAYSTDERRHEVSWQVIDVQSNEALRAGISKAALDSGDAREIQEKLLSRLALSLAGEEGVIVSLEAARQLVTPSIGYGCVLQADVALARIDPEGLASAHGCLEKSVSYQAADADVLASLAMVLVATGEASAAPTVAERALKLADKAVALAPQSSQSYVAQMQARFAAGETEAAFISGRRAAALNPLDDAIPARLGLLLFVSGAYSDGVNLARMADAGSEYLHHDAALTLALEDYRSGRYREALRRARELANPADTAVNLLRVAAAGQLGLTREATSALDGLRLGKTRSPQPYEAELVARGYAPDLIALLDDGLAKAGLQPVAQQ